MVSQTPEGGWETTPVRSGSMLSLDGRQRPPTTRTPPSYYDAVRSRHSLSQPISRQPEGNKKERPCFPQQTKYNSLPRPLPQRYPPNISNGHDKYPPSPGPWPGVPLPASSAGASPVIRSSATGWNSASSSRSHHPEQPPTGHREYLSPPGPANHVPQTHHLSPRSRDGIPSNVPRGPFPGQQPISQARDVVQPFQQQHQQQLPQHHMSADVLHVRQSPCPPFGESRQAEGFVSQAMTMQHPRHHPPAGPRQHPPPPIPGHVQHPATGPSINGIEMRRNSLTRRDSGELQDNPQHSRWIRRSFPASEDIHVYTAHHYRPHPHDPYQGHPLNSTFDPRYTRSGTLPSRPVSIGSDPVVPAPLVAVRTGPLGTYPESRPTHTDHLPPPSSVDHPEASGLARDWNGLSAQLQNQRPEINGRIKDVVKPTPRTPVPPITSRPMDSQVLPLISQSLRRTAMSSSTASLCSEVSSASSRVRKSHSHKNGDVTQRGQSSGGRIKSSSSDTSSPGRRESKQIISPSPWEREEKEQLQKRQVQGARRARDEEIENLESLPSRSQKQEELLRILRLEREFQRRADEAADDEDEEEEDDDLLERAEHRERMLRMQEEMARARAQRLERSSDPKQQQQQNKLNNSSDDWLARRKMQQLSRIAEENGDIPRDQLQSAVDLEQLNDLLETLSKATISTGSHLQQATEMPEVMVDEETDLNISGRNGDCHKQPDLSNGTHPSENSTFPVSSYNKCNSFPVPAPRPSKTPGPPPVPPKTKTTADVNGHVDYDLRGEYDSINIKKQTTTSSSKTTLPVETIRLKEPVPASTRQKTALPNEGSDVANVKRKTKKIQNGFETKTVNGFESKATNGPTNFAARPVREVDIASLYASSKTRAFQNGSAKTKNEQKSPEIQKLWNSRPEKLTFLDKIRKFSLQAGDSDVPKDKVKNSRAQREIEIKFNEGQNRETSET